MIRYRAFAVGLVAAAPLLTMTECSSTSGTGAAAGATGCTASIQASSYEQTCKTDSDCVAVGQGSACGPCDLACTNAAINVAAHGQYVADVAKTPAGSTSGCTVSCAVGAGSATCCHGGVCHADSLCSGNDSSSGGYASLCPVFGDQPTCPAAADASGCNLSLGDNCSADALPQGLSCSGMSQCQARIGPVDGCGRVDGWICSCIDGSWSCDDCALGAALCEGGAGAYELPDSGAP
jgi:hypothetical protein